MLKKGLLLTVTKSIYPPFFVDNNSLDFLESQLTGSNGNRVRVLLIEAIDKKLISCPFPIMSEYEEKSDPPMFCEDLELKKIFVNKKELDVITQLSGVASDFPHTLKRIKKTNRNPGDPWLLANALAKEGTIVTEELPSKGGIAGKQKNSLKKLPDICQAASIKWTNGQGLLDWCENNLMK